MQNANRISYGGDTAYIFFPGKVMRIRCPRIGIGYFDLPNHKVNQQLNIPCSAREDMKRCIHGMIHIHKEFLKEVYIDFGFKNANGSVCVRLIHEKLAADYGGSIVLLAQNYGIPPPVLIGLGNGNNSNSNNYGLCHGSNGSVCSFRHNPMQ